MFKHLLILVVLLSAQISMVPLLPGIYKNINAALVVVVFICVVFRFDLGVLYALTAGFVLDLYSALPFGTMILGYAITIYLIYIIFKKLLTNKSFYTLLGLCAISTIIYNTVLFIARALMLFSATKDFARVVDFASSFSWHGAWQILFNTVFMILLFIVFYSSGRRFKAVFVDTARG